MNQHIRPDVTPDTPGVHLSTDPEIQELQKQLMMVDLRIDNAELRKKVAELHGLLNEREAMDQRSLKKFLVDKLNKLNDERLKAQGQGPQKLASHDPLATRKGT